MWNNETAGSRKIRSCVFTGGLLKYIVCDLVIAVVNKPVNKPGKAKLKCALEVRCFSEMKRNENEPDINIWRMESSVASSCVCFFYSSRLCKIIKETFIFEI